MTTSNYRNSNIQDLEAQLPQMKSVTSRTNWLGGLQHTRYLAIAFAIFCIATIAVWVTLLMSTSCSSHRSLVGEHGNLLRSLTSRSLAWATQRRDTSDDNAEDLLNEPDAAQCIIGVEPKDKKNNNLWCCACASCENENPNDAEKCEICGTSRYEQPPQANLTADEFLAKLKVLIEEVNGLLLKGDETATAGEPAKTSSSLSVNELTEFEMEMLFKCLDKDNDKHLNFEEIGCFFSLICGEKLTPKDYKETMKDLGVNDLTDGLNFENFKSSFGDLDHLEGIREAYEHVVRKGLNHEVVDDNEKSAGISVAGLSVEQTEIMSELYKEFLKSVQDI